MGGQLRFSGQAAEGIAKVGQEVAFGTIGIDADGLRRNAEGKETAGEPLLVDRRVTLIGVRPGPKRTGLRPAGGIRGPLAASARLVVRAGLSRPGRKQHVQCQCLYDIGTTISVSCFMEKGKF